VDPLCVSDVVRVNGMLLGSFRLGEDVPDLIILECTLTSSTSKNGSVDTQAYQLIRTKCAAIIKVMRFDLLFSCVCSI